MKMFANNFVFLMTKMSGFGQIPWTINAEIFPPEAKSLSSSIAFGFNWFCGFLVTKFYPDLEKLIHASGAYLLFAIICASGEFAQLTKYI